MIEKLKKNFFKIIGITILIIGIFIIFIDKEEEIVKEKKEEEKIVSFFEEETTYTENVKNDEYIAILEIPKIDLKKGLYDIANNYNDIEYNIEIIKQNFPNEKNSNLVLASHSGSSNIAYFKNLYQLEINDKIYLYYKNIKYEYILKDIYDVKKDGDVEIKRENKTSITLITCTKDNDDLQTVYIGYLNNEINY